MTTRAEALDHADKELRRLMLDAACKYARELFAEGLAREEVIPRVRRYIDGDLAKWYRWGFCRIAAAIDANEVTAGPLH